jgi:hypothetical protein
MIPKKMRTMRKNQLSGLRLIVVGTIRRGANLHEPREDGWFPMIAAILVTLMRVLTIFMLQWTILRMLKTKSKTLNKWKR